MSATQTSKQPGPAPAMKMPKPIEWFLNMWFEPTSPARWRLFERAFALTYIIYVADWSQWATEWLTNVGFHPTASMISSVYPPPITPMDPTYLPFFLIIVFAAPTFVIFGIFKRISLFVCCLCTIYIQLVDLNAAFTLTKLYIVFFFLQSIAPSPKWVFLPGKEEPVLRVSSWPIRIIQTTLCIQYCTAGTCKMFHGDWLKVSDILYGHSVGLYRNQIATYAIHYLPRPAWVVQSAMALMFEALAPLLFIIRRLRPIGIVVGVGMHIVIAVLMKDLLLFSAQMIAFYVLFLPERWCDVTEEWLDKHILSKLRGLVGLNKKAKPSSSAA